MAKVYLTITRDNGTSVNCEGEVDDLYVIEVATMLAAMIFDSAATASLTASDTET